MTPSGRIKRAGLLMSTWNGVVERLENMYNERSQVADGAIRVLPVSNIDNVERALQQKNEKLTLPYIGVTPSVFEPDVSSFNATVMRRYGVKTRISADRSTWTILSLVPQLVTYQIMFVTDDVFTLTNMIDRWQSQEIWGFMLTEQDYRVRIQIQADKSFQVPPSSPDSAGSDQFRQTSTLRAKTYAGYVWQIPSIFAVDTQIGFTQGDLSRILQGEDIEDIGLNSVLDASSHQPEA